nr:putative immunity function [Saccharomycopsis crataegensis]
MFDISILYNAYNGLKSDYSSLNNLSQSYLQCCFSRGILIDLDFAQFMYTKYKHLFTKPMYICYTQRLIMSNIINEKLILKYKPFCIWYRDLPNEVTLNKLMKFSFLHDSIAVVCLIKNDHLDLLNKLNLVNEMYIYDLSILLNRDNYFNIIPIYPYELKNIHSYNKNINKPSMHRYFSIYQDDLTFYNSLDMMLSENYFSDPDCPNGSCNMTGVFGYGLEMNEFDFEICYINNKYFNLSKNNDLYLKMLKSGDIIFRKCFNEFNIIDIFEISSEIDIILDSMIIKSHLYDLYESDFSNFLLDVSAFSGNYIAFKDQLNKANFKVDLVCQFDYYKIMSVLISTF